MEDQNRAQRLQNKLSREELHLLFGQFPLFKNDPSFLAALLLCWTLTQAVHQYTARGKQVRQSQCATQFERISPMEAYGRCSYAKRILIKIQGNCQGLKKYLHTNFWPASYIQFIIIMLHSVA